MKKLTAGLFCLVVLAIANGQKHPNFTYLKLEYGGEEDKALPQVIFYLDSFDVYNLQFGKAFKISKCEFASIEVAILEDKFVEKANISALGYYNFTLVRNEMKLRFIRNVKTGFPEFFDQISKKIKNVKMKNEINYLFDRIVRKMR